jgi:hypothetical protein
VSKGLDIEMWLENKTLLAREGYDFLLSSGILVLPDNCLCTVPSLNFVTALKF